MPAALLGGGLCAIGLLLVVAGWRGYRIGGPSLLSAQRLGARVGIAVVIGVVMLAVTGWPVAGVLAGGFAFMSPRLVGGAKAQKADIELTEAVASWAEMLRDTMAAAAGLEQAITATAAVSPETIRPAVRALSGRLKLQSLESALEDFAVEVAHPTADLIAAALSLSATKSVRRLGDLLATLADAARADATMRLRVEAGRARTRSSVRVVVGVTGVAALGLLVFDGTYLAPYGTPLGQFMLAIIGGLFGLAFWWLQRLGQSGLRHSAEVSA